MAPPTPPQQARRIGLVTFYHKRRKFGFIRDVFTGEIFFVHDSAIDYDPAAGIPRYKKSLKTADYVEFVPASGVTGGPDQLTRVEFVTGVAGGPLRYQFMHQLMQERQAAEGEEQPEATEAETQATTTPPPPSKNAAAD